MFDSAQSVVEESGISAMRLSVTLVSFDLILNLSGLRLVKSQSRLAANLM